MNDYYAVVYKDFFNRDKLCNLSMHGKYESTHVTNDIRHAVEVVKYMIAYTGENKYRVVRVKLEEMG